MNAASLNDLEVPAYDVVDMAVLMATLVQDTLGGELTGGFIQVTNQQADALFFASRLMIEKAEAVKSKWIAAHDAQPDVAAPVRMTGGARS